MMEIITLIVFAAAWVLGVKIIGSGIEMEMQNKGSHYSEKEIEEEETEDSQK